MTAPLPIRVWDVGVRAFHWGLVVAIAAACVTGFLLGRTTLGWHLVAGEAVVVALAWRLVWGVAGNGYARFAGFAYGPAAVLAHIGELRSGRAHRHLGHNPLGAVMVFALIAVSAAIAVTGTVVLGGLLKQGPLRAFLPFAAGRGWLGPHKLLAVLLLLMIVGHLAGVAFESWRGRENLVRAMLTGDKPALPAAAPARRMRAHPWAAIAVTLSVLVLGAGATARLAALPGLGVPPAVPDPVFAEQCGACHLAFPASLAPAASWTAILADLKHHFGADASLAADQTAHIETWLVANAAEHWDTLPSHLLRTQAADGSHRITHTPGWMGRHRHIAAAVFKAAPVYRRSDCTACHADAATGRFAPQNIAIPAGG